MILHLFQAWNSQGDVVKVLTWNAFILDQFIKQVPGFIVNVSVKSVGLYVEVGSW